MASPGTPHLLRQNQGRKHLTKTHKSGLCGSQPWKWCIKVEQYQQEDTLFQNILQSQGRFWYYTGKDNTQAVLFLKVSSHEFVEWWDFISIWTFNIIAIGRITFLYSFYTINIFNKLKINLCSANIHIRYRTTAFSLSCP